MGILLNQLNWRLLNDFPFLFNNNNNNNNKWFKIKKNTSNKCIQDLKYSFKLKW